MNGFFPANEHNPAGPFPSFPPPLSFAPPLCHSRSPLSFAPPLCHSRPPSVIRAPPLSFAPPLCHSRESGNPEKPEVPAATSLSS